MNAAKKITKARTGLILDHPFFGCLSLRMPLIESEEVPTACTDGEQMIFNPNYINKLSSQQVLGMVAHEVMHSALGHFWRQGSRDAKLWNIATDYTINSSLIEAGMSLPEGALVNGLYSDMSAEEIYTTLQQEEQQKQQQQSQSGQGEGKGQSSKDKQDQNSKGKQQGAPDPGMCGSVMPAKKKSKTEVDKSKAMWKAAMTQALQTSRGNVPNNLKRQIDEVLYPPVPWHVLLRDLVEKTARNDYDWTSADRRYLQSGIFLPDLISEQIPEIVIAIDTSCSITKEMLSIFANEASAVLGAYETLIRVIYCDAKVQGESEFTRSELPLQLELKGGGGTKFEPVFNHIHKKGYQPACLIYFTDLDGSFPNKEPEYPVMWLVPKRERYEKTAPFGQTVNF